MSVENGCDYYFSCSDCACSYCLVVKQREEIKRLTEENNQTKDLLTNTVNELEKLKIENRLVNSYRTRAQELLDENKKLQKQVDNLKIKTCPNTDYCGGRIQQAVKDTAKEILQPLAEWLKIVIKHIKDDNVLDFDGGRITAYKEAYILVLDSGKRYGVEVE